MIYILNLNIIHIESYTICTYGHEHVCISRHIVFTQFLPACRSSLNRNTHVYIIAYTHSSSSSSCHQVCFPGGMVEENLDVNIIETCLREMEEEIGFPSKDVDVLGVLRCDWSEVAKITGIGVTPVVGFCGELSRYELKPNASEVEELFTIPVYTLLDQEKWITSTDLRSVIFAGGPHIIWGLTAYILDRFINDILLRYRIEDIKNPGSGMYSKNEVDD